MKRMTVECACERGGDCTRTTMCALDNALQDQADEFESAIQRIQDVLDDPDWGNVFERIQAELNKLEN
jgi:hypothetical protein